MIQGKKRPQDKAASKGGDESVKEKHPKLVIGQQPQKDQNLQGKKTFATVKSVTGKTNRPSKILAVGRAGQFNKTKFKPNYELNKNKMFPRKAGDKNVTDKNEKEPEKTDWRKYKQDKKDLKIKRKQSRDSYEISLEAKQIYEKLKCRTTGKKQELVEKLCNLFSAADLLKKIVMAHDTARIIQCMLKFAAPPLREELSEKLLPYSVEMSTSKYSHFCVLRMFKYGSPAIKSKLVDSFLGNIVMLACHNISSKILDHAYLTVANAKQKIYMRQEFYGDLYKRSKDDNIKELSDAYKESPNMKASILGSVKSNLDHVANKKLVDSSLVHAVILEYLRECDEEKIEETVTMYATLIPLMLSTKDGSQAAIICFYKATPKNRRAIIKAIKEHLVKICTHEHGHIFILGVLNSLDDTKATKKAIYDNIHPEIHTLISNQWGRRVIEWLIAPADTNCFHPSFIANMENGLQYGKKDKDLRRKEIFEQVAEPIANAIAEQPEFWISNRHIALVTAGIINKISGTNFEKAAKALATVICDSSWSVKVEEEGTGKEKIKKSQDIEKIIAAATKLKKKKSLKTGAENADDKNGNTYSKDGDDDDVKEGQAHFVSGIEEAGLHIALKKIIKHDKERMGAENATFGSALVQQLNSETLKYWLTVNRGCFIILKIVENNNESTIRTLKELLEPLKDELKKQTTSGSRLLLRKLAL